MITRLLAGAATLALSAVLVATTATTATAGLQPRTLLRAFSCHRALDPPDRSVSLTAVMRPLAGTRHMAMKFDLLMSSGGTTGSPTPVHAGDLGVWIRPRNPTLGRLPGDVWNVQKSVVNLAAPAVYRFRVMFRWTGSGGHWLGTTIRYSPKCRQRELRPDLLVRSIAVAPSANNPNYDIYTAVIANRGNSSAGPFVVLFAPADGSATETQTVALLRAHSSITQSFAGPVCTADNAPTITADSTSEVDDLNRDNNALTAICPASPSG